MKDRRPGAETDGHHANGGAHADQVHLHAEEIRQELSRIVNSSPFRDANRLTSFLSFVVGMTLAGNGGKLKAYTIAVEALGRGTDFDPQTDPIVRVEAVRLRQALARYYSGIGRDDPLVIEVPRGSYVPAFRCRHGGEGPKPAAGAPLAAGARPEVKSSMRSGQDPATDFAIQHQELSESIRRFRELAKAHRRQVAAMAAAVQQARRTLLDARTLLQAYRGLDLACGPDRPLLPTAQPCQPNELRPADGRETQRQQTQGAAAARPGRPRTN
jgi:hypothetical protein